MKSLNHLFVLHMQLQDFQIIQSTILMGLFHKKTSNHHGVLRIAALRAAAQPQFSQSNLWKSYKKYWKKIFPRYDSLCIKDVLWPKKSLCSSWTFHHSGESFLSPLFERPFAQGLNLCSGFGASNGKALAGISELWVQIFKKDPKTDSKVIFLKLFWKSRI